MAYYDVRYHFHDAIVEIIANASYDEMTLLGRLLILTVLPENQAAVYEAWTKRCKELSFQGDGVTQPRRPGENAQLPFHETLIPVIQSASARELQTVGRLIASTVLMGNFAAISDAWKERCRESGIPQYYIEMHLSAIQEQQECSCTLHRK